MNTLDIRKRFSLFADKMNSQIPLSSEEYKFLANVFSRIGEGEDPSRVLGLALKRGNSIKDEKHRYALSYAIMWIEAAIQPVDVYPPGFGYGITKACEEVAPLLRRILGVADTEKYDAEYIRQCYYNPKYAHLRDPVRSILDLDSPIPF